MFEVEPLPDYACTDCSTWRESDFAAFLAELDEAGLTGDAAVAWGTLALTQDVN